MTPRKASAIARVGERRIKGRRLTDTDIVQKAADAEAAHWRALMLVEIGRVASLEERVRLLDQVILSQHAIIEGLNGLLGKRNAPAPDYHDPIATEVQ
jgi:hypothetical protein